MTKDFNGKGEKNSFLILKKKKNSHKNTPSLLDLMALSRFIRRGDSCHRDYDFAEDLGTGNFATVKRGVDKTDGSNWAIKCVDKRSLSREDRAALDTEVELMAQIDHPNVVKLKTIYDCGDMFYMYGNIVI